MMLNELSPEIKRKSWGEGPWVDEPDHLEFSHKGLKCSVRRIILKRYEDIYHGGHLCGYVRLPKNRPWHETDNDKLDVHGGITFYQEDEDNDGYRWVGFDCAHAFDLMPCFNQSKCPFEMEDEMEELASYKTMDFVIDQTKQLADQIHEAFNIEMDRNK